MDTIWNKHAMTAERPKYMAVVNMIRGHVAEGVLAPGDKLPPVRDLAWELGITPGTVARAYTVLNDAGVLFAEVGRGTFVSDQRRPAPSPALPGVIEADAVPHGEGGDVYRVNLFSPHLPNGGQAALIQDHLARVAANPPSGVMHYPSRLGARPARQAMVRWLRDVPIGTFTEADIVLCHGGQSGILLAFQVTLRGALPAILVEDLCYPGFRRAAELLRADVVPVPCDEDGIIPEALADVAQRHPEAQMLCTSPDVHSPTCGYTPLERRRAIVDVARKANLQILEDGCYQIGDLRGPGYRALAPERGWFLTSLSKTITPSLRVGCLVGPEGKSDAVQRAAEHGFFGLATPILDLTTGLLNDPALDRVVARSREGVGAYVKSAVNILGAFDLKWRPDVPLLWLHLPRGWRASAFCQAAERCGVEVRAAEEFADRDAPSPHAVRMAINGGVTLASFSAAMERLRNLLENPPEQISV